MKICIIGFQRSRSSLLLETISNYYGIPLLGEDINNNGNLLPREDWRHTGDVHKVPQPYYNSLRLLLTKNNRKREGVIRFHPTQFSFIPFSAGIVDFELFDFKQYDKIYFTVRNHVDAIASLFVARQLNTFTYQSEDMVFKNINKMTITDLIDVWKHTLSEIISVKLKEYFSTVGINYTELDYDEIPSYIVEHYPGAESLHVETNYDYKSIIDNYDAIDKMYKDNYALVAQLVEAALSKGVQ